MTLDDLLAVPRETRDEAWVAAFHDAVPDAPMTAGDLVAGPDGFPYLPLTPGGPTSVRHVLDRCLADGTGIVVLGRGGEAEMALIYGDLWSFRETGRFVVSSGPPVTLTEPRDAVVGIPDERMLPAYARAALRRELAGQGIADPVVTLVRTPGFDPEWSFAFRPRPDRRVLWYLPRHCGLVAAADDWMGAPL